MTRVRAKGQGPNFKCNFVCLIQGVVRVKVMTGHWVWRRAYGMGLVMVWRGRGLERLWLSEDTLLVAGHFGRAGSETGVDDKCGG